MTTTTTGDGRRDTRRREPRRRDTNPVRRHDDRRDDDARDDLARDDHDDPDAKADEDRARGAIGRARERDARADR